MREVEDYRIVQSINPNMVEEKVKEFIAKGYQLNGVTFPASVISTNNMAITQAMVKYKDDQTEA